MACFDLSADNVSDFVKFLMSKGADPNLADLEGYTPLHILATYKSRIRQQENNGQLDSGEEYQRQLAAEKKARL
jgi:ankyrin repeat protein